MALDVGIVKAYISYDEMKVIDRFRNRHDNEDRSTEIRKDTMLKMLIILLKLQVRVSTKDRLSSHRISKV
jgi:hypothetical protein